MQITISNLKKVFGTKTAVDIRELSIHQSEILGLVGNNGAGKTTFFRLLLDLLLPEDGKVLFTTSDGKTLCPTESEEWKAYVGSYMDEGFLIDFLTPDEYFEFIGKVDGLSPDEISHRLADYEKFAHGELFGQKKLIRDLSAGNKQKVGIIAALLQKPELLILDEPFNFLDPSGQNALKQLLTEYNRLTGATILVSSHNLQHTVDISTHITLMENGCIIHDLPNANRSAEAELNAYFLGEE